MRKKSSGLRRERESIRGIIKRETQAEFQIVSLAEFLRHHLTRRKRFLNGLDATKISSENPFIIKSMPETPA